MRNLFYLLLFACFLLLYAVTAQRGVSWQDSGEFQYRVLAHDYFWISGIARSHPAYIAGAELFASLFPHSSTFYSLNLFSGLGMALALLFLATVFSQLRIKPSTTLIVALTLGLSHMAWWMSTVAEVYTWSLAFLLAEVFCVVKICNAPEQRAPPSRLAVWILLALLNGLHASLHNFAFLNLPVYAILFIYLHARSRLSHTVRALAMCSVAWLIGACLLVCLFSIEWQSTSSLTATVKSLLFGHEFETVVLGTRAINWPLALSNFALASISLLNPGWFFVCFSWRTHTRNALFKMALLGLTVIHFIFWIRYFVPDQATFVMPLLALIALWVGIGLDSLALTRRQAVVLGLAVVLSALATPQVIHQVLLTKQGGVKRARELPFREESGYWLFPWKHNERSAALFVEHVRALLRDGDVLIADNTAAGPVMAAQAAGLLSSNIRIIAFFTGETDEELLRLIKAKERVYIVSPVAGYASNALLTGLFTFEKEDVLYRIRNAHHE